ncbi:Rne/Rng family ribonuclease [Chitinispirillales bacterium ANBcel5]|uniref:Rne/Rng family ribonuclease n=1 Tax=Cellulosispirillum alkaliphilum TaxID=3039283 RepID=UPI002A505DBF|nr:Rne/Rng family ribonuclease [Chitinispirillales bacterium ANBcel5]
MTKKILFNASPTEKRAALLENDKLVEVVVERPDHFRLVGNIYRGRVESILPGIQAAFIDIGLERCAFLHASDVDPSLLLEADDTLMERYTGHGASKRGKVPKIPIEKVLTVGQEILVQVQKEPIGSKGAKITTQISLAGRFLVLVPDTDFIGVSKKTHDTQKRSRLKRLISQIKPKGVGFIVRTIGLKVSESEFIKEIHLLLDAWRKTQEEALSGTGPKLIYHELGITTRVIRDLFSEDVQQVYADEEEDYNEIISYLAALSPALREKVILYKDAVPLFDKFDIEKELERLLKRKVWLKSGGYILIDRTEALVAIDVNTGRNVGKSNLEETIFKTNYDAVGEICRQLRLRDIGGLIVVDFIDMQNPENRKKIENEVRKALDADPTATSCTGLSKFCLIEITRKRVRPELQEFFSDVCHACGGLGWVFSPETVTARIDRTLRRTQQKPSVLTLSVHPAVSAYLKKDEGAVKKMLENEHDCQIKVIEDEQLDQDEYSFEEIEGGNSVTSE